MVEELYVAETLSNENSQLTIKTQNPQNSQENSQQ